jgi:hypothetical protein
MKKTIITTAALFFMAVSFNSCVKNDTPLDEGIVYDVISAPAHANEIDLIWSEAPGAVAIVSPNEYSPFYSPSEGDHPSFKESVLFTSWSQRNQTLIDVHPNLTVADFSAIATSAQLNSSIGQVFDNTTSQFASMTCSSADFAKVFFVETTTSGVKKRGYIRFTSGQKGDNNFVNFEIKMNK